MPDAKLQHSNKADLLNLAATVLNPAYSEAMGFRTEQIGWTVTTLSTKSGSLEIQSYISGPENDEVLEDAKFHTVLTRAITANVVDINTFNGAPLPLRAKFTPGAGGAYDINCKVFGFGG